MYLSVVALTMLPVIIGMFIPKSEREWYSAILAGVLLYIFWPAAQILGFAALRVQAKETRSLGSHGSLSVKGLFVQALVFLILGISFCVRFQSLMDGIEEEDPDPDSPRNSPEWNTPLARFVMYAPAWYWLVGWSTINTFVFAFSQGALGLIARRNDRDGKKGECAPLLEDDVS